MGHKVIRHKDEASRRLVAKTIAAAVPNKSSFVGVITIKERQLIYQSELYPWFILSGRKYWTKTTGLGSGLWELYVQPDGKLEP